MSFQTSTLASDAYANLRSNMRGWKLQAQSALAFTQANSIDTNYVFGMLDQLRSIISTINTMVAVSGLNAYATGLGYSGTMTTDANAVATAATNCISWVTTNFPKDAGSFLQAYTLNADGTRTAASFTPAQTGGLQTSLSALIATIQ